MSGGYLSFATVAMSIVLLGALVFDIFRSSKAIAPARAEAGDFGGPGFVCLIVAMVVAMFAHALGLANNFDHLMKVFSADPAIRDVILRCAPYGIGVYGYFRALVLLAKGRDRKSLFCGIGLLWMSGPLVEVLLPDGPDAFWLEVSAAWTTAATLWLLFSGKSKGTYGL